MYINYVVTHCYRKDYDDERWDVVKVFDIVEDAIKYCEGNSVAEGFLFIDVGWSKERS